MSPITPELSPGYGLMYLSVTATGVLCHFLFFSRGEWHLQASNLLYLFLLSQVLMTSYFVTTYSFGISEAAQISGTLGLGYLVGVMASMMVYRLALHRLRYFPGPKLAAMSKLWHAVSVADGKGHLLLDDLHQRYGDFVRTGPTEVAIFHPDILGVFADAHKNGLTKPAWYDLLRDLGGLNLHRDKQKHSTRRRIWLQALSKRATLDYRPALNTCLDEFCKLIRSTAGEPVDFSSFCAWFGWDFMGMFSFSQSFGMMKTRGWDESIKLLRSAMNLLAPSTPVPWAFHLAIDIPILSEARVFRRMLEMGKANMDSRIKVESPLADISEHLIQWSQRRDSLERDREALRGDAITLMIAGSDTMNVSLQFLFYVLARDRHHLTKLRREIDQISEPMDPDRLASLPYLNGLINEIMRLFPAIPTAGIRETPPEGLAVAGVYIPGNTVIYAPRYTIGRLESCFDRPLEIIPERWNIRPELIKKANCFYPFAAGTYSCVGKGLALEAMRLVVATVARQFDLKLASADDVGKIEEAYCDNLTAVASNLNVVFTERVGGLCTGPIV